MEAIHATAKQLERLQAVQGRVRALVEEHTWVGEAIHAASKEYSVLLDRFAMKQAELLDRKRRLARELLEAGWLFDPKARDDSQYLIVQVRGLCSATLAARLKEHGRGDTLPRKLEREGAAAALAAFDRESVSQKPDSSQRPRGAMRAGHRAAVGAETHKEFVWMIAVSRPADWQEPLDPRSLEGAELRRWSDAEYLTIALHRLGGLADVRALRLIVPEPMRNGDWARDCQSVGRWLARLPVAQASLNPGDPLEGPLSVEVLPPDVAEQMLRHVETWVKDEAAKRGESRDGSGLSACRDLSSGSPRATVDTTPGLSDRVPQRGTEETGRAIGGHDAEGVIDGASPDCAKPDDVQYLPATWFPKGMAARLRMAAQKNRKTKRVATRKIDGVVCYSVADARRWWSDEVPKKT